MKAMGSRGSKFEKKNTKNFHMSKPVLPPRNPKILKISLDPSYRSKIELFKTLSRDLGLNTQVKIRPKMAEVAKKIDIFDKIRVFIKFFGKIGQLFPLLNFFRIFKIFFFKIVVKFYAGIGTSKNRFCFKIN